MAFTVTTLAAAKATNDMVINVTSATNAAKKGLALVSGAEWMLITDISLSPVLGVVPGYGGSPAGPHGILAPVVIGLTTDFTSTGFTYPNTPVGLSFGGATDAITGTNGTGVPLQSCIVYLTRATAGAYTLAAPAKDQTNTIIFVSTTAAAHTLTYTAGFSGNTTSSDVVTFPSTVSACFTIRAYNGLWAAVADMATGGVTGPA